MKDNCFNNENNNKENKDNKDNKDKNINNIKVFKASLIKQNNYKNSNTFFITIVFKLIIRFVDAKVLFFHHKNRLILQKKCHGKPCFAFPTS